MKTPRITLCFLLALAMPATTQAQSQLERELLNTPLQQLVAGVAQSGDAARGALVFHSPNVGCAQCHRVDESQASAIGPNLARSDERVSKPTTESIIESILRPSATIDKKYASVRIATDDGKILSGVIVERTDAHLKLRFGPRPDDESTIATADIETEAPSALSIMPAGIVSQLDERIQFLDLVAYVAAVAKDGPAMAASLAPRPEQLQIKLPEYESRVDHAGLISSWNKKSLERGRKVYMGLCNNCHGTKETAGSLPTALRFGESKFKNGNDPFSMYKTLTHGYGLMLPQKWMVPKQKYDVIQFIREEFLRELDPGSYSRIDRDYLKSLPTGDTLGPEPVVSQPWADMDYGNVLSTTIEFGKDGSNIAQKAIAFRMDKGTGGIAKGRVWMAFEHDTLRWSAGWHGNRFVDWRGIQFDGAHGIHPRAVGDIGFSNPTEPGWANPETGRFDDDQRVLGRDGKRYGPLPKPWGKYLGMYRKAGARDKIQYEVDRTRVHEQPFLIEHPDGEILYGRTVHLEAVRRPLKMKLATIPGTITASTQNADHVSLEWKDSSNKTNRFEAWWVSDREPLRWMMDGERLCLEWPDSDKPSTLAVAFGAVSSGEAQSALNGEAWTKFVRTELQKELLGKREAARSHDSENRATVGPHDSENRATVRPHDSENRATVGNRVGEVPLEIFETTSRVWFEGNGWAVDEIETPSLNRWKARTRVTGLAFYPDENAMAVCTWDGDVWRVTGFDSLGSSTPKIGWQRIATGLFQPLGILVLKDGMMVTCRDQLVKMRDLDGDHVIEDYVCFNSDHQVTEHFHEFAMGLQQDKLGNFLYAKSARHALKAVVPHHGTLLRVSPDGATTGILATGFRAANGVCLNPDGSFVVTDQEGHWNPKNRINWVEPGKFYGNMFGYHAVTDVSDAAMQPPLCWITNSFDRSPAELLWVDSQRWGSLNGSLLNLSYGYGRIYVVPFETVDGIKQGGMCALPIPDLPTGIVRGRFSPRDGQLYVGGMFAWASSRQDQEGGLYRIRPTGRSVDLPIALHVKRNNEKQPTVEIGFSDPLDRNSASDTKRYKIKAWDLRRSEKYGSDHYNERELDVVSALLLKDNKTIVITIPSLQPTWGMSIDVQLTTNDGREFKRTIHNSVHKIP